MLTDRPRRYATSIFHTGCSMCEPAIATFTEHLDHAALSIESPIAGIRYRSSYKNAVESYKFSRLGQFARFQKISRFGRGGTVSRSFPFFTLHRKQDPRLKRSSLMERTFIGWRVTFTWAWPRDSQSGIVKRTLLTSGYNCRFQEAVWIDDTG